MAFEESYFYSDKIPDAEFNLNPKESHHILKVLRLKKENRIYVTDGKGTLALCEILKAQSKNVQIKTLDFLRTADEVPAITLAAGLTKRTGFEALVESVSQLPVKEIIPFSADFSTVNSKDFEKSLDRLNQKAIAALKQSKRVYATCISKPQRLDKILENCRDFDTACLFEKTDNNRQQADITAWKNARSMLLITGPEGGFSRNEILKAKAQGIPVLGLGNSRLRAETAGLAAVVAVLTRIDKLI
jgi:16S rRNA (uracil1498-N3)-methyltransferase